MNTELPEIDVVIIGVNAERSLAQCLDSLMRLNYPQHKLHIFYVDGGSTDSSCNIASSYDGKVSVIQKQLAHPTPGWQRNLGAQAGKAPYILFLDSDVTLHQEWLLVALKNFRPSVGAIRGLRKERYPNATHYNWIADQEWNASEEGEVSCFGGDVMMVRAALEESGYYDPSLVGGEEPDLSQKLRAKGWKIIQLHHPMTEHDIGMKHWKQYVKRAFRTGYAFAAVSHRYAQLKDRFWNEEYQRIIKRGGGSVTLFAGALVSLIASFHILVSLSLVTFALLLIFFPYLFRERCFADKKFNPQELKIYSLHCSLVVLPEFIGVLRFFYGWAFHVPLRNHVSQLKTQLTGGTL